MQDRITTCLWFDANAEEAVDFYVSLFENSRIVSVMHYGEAGPGPAGSVLSIGFKLDGRSFMALNGGPAYSFTPAVSMFVRCASQQQIDTLWDRLLEGGQAQQCGWITDRFGLSWQIVPDALEGMLQDEDPKRSSRVMAALLQMVKLDLRALEQVYNQ